MSPFEALEVSNSFLVGGIVPLGSLLDVVASTLDTLDTCYDLYATSGSDDLDDDDRPQLAPSLRPKPSQDPIIASPPAPPDNSSSEAAEHKPSLPLTLSEALKAAEPPPSPTS